MSARTPAVPAAVRRPAIPASSVLLWLLATWLVALAPLLYFALGVGDGADERGRVQLAAIPVAMAWPLLVGAIGLARRRQRRAMGLVVGAAARRAGLLVLLAAAILALARHLGNGAGIEGDLSWTLLWAVAGVGWAASSAASVRRP